MNLDIKYVCWSVGFAVMLLNKPWNCGIVNQRYLTFKLVTTRDFRMTSVFNSRNESSPKKPTLSVNSPTNYIKMQCAKPRAGHDVSHVDSVTGLDLSFTDHVTAYSSRTTWELVKARMIYGLFSRKFVVENNQLVNRCDIGISYTS